MSVFIWSFVQDFLYHLMPSFVWQILWKWLSKHNEPTCQACPWFVPAAARGSEDFLSSSPCKAVGLIADRIQQLPAVMGRAVLCGFSGKVRRAAAQTLIPAHALVFAGGLRQGKDFPGIACGPTAAPPAARGFLQGMNSWCSCFSVLCLQQSTMKHTGKDLLYCVLQGNTSRKHLDALLHLPENFCTAFVHNNPSIPAFFLVLSDVSSTANFFDSFLVCSSGTLSPNRD